MPSIDFLKVKKYVCINVVQKNLVQIRRLAKKNEVISNIDVKKLSLQKSIFQFPSPRQSAVTHPIN